MSIMRSVHYHAGFWFLALPYSLQFRVLDKLASLAGVQLRDPKNVEKHHKYMLGEIQQAFWQDADNIAKGIYPASLRQNIGPVEQTIGFMRILADYPKVLQRRREKDTKLDEGKYPEYFNRAYHFQTDGYTSEHSARLYDQQVEILFAGTANIMRRQVIADLHPYIEGKKVKVLEVGCGTGSATDQFARAFPQAKIKATDISEEYIEFAKKQRRRLKNVSFDAQDAAALNERDGSYDVTYQVFLSHEVPQKVREQIMEEQIRILKPGGYGVILESLQLDDKPRINDILRDFPRKYHEPFFMNYIKNRLEDFLGGRDDLEVLHSNMSFMSKAITFRKKKKK